MPDKKQNNKKEEEKESLAKKWVNAINRLPRAELQILLRSSGDFGGVIFRREKKQVNGTFRTVIHYIKPDGSSGKEYLDFMPDPAGEPEDARPIIFPPPFVMTARKKPGFDDDEESFEWLLDQRRASYLQGLKNDLIKRNHEISELNWRIDELRTIINRQENEIKVLSERIRMYEDDVERLSRENILLKRTVTQLEEVARKSLAGYIESEKALNEIMRKAELLGQERVMSPVERLKQIAEESKEVMEIIQAGHSRDELSYEMFAALQRRINDLDAKINRLLERREEQVISTPPSQ